nr:MAG TPA_asm: NfeD-like C-terminal, partner-binding [Caudoviricetes sp.]
MSLYNKSITFKVGDRVKVAKISGTYIVEYPIN